MYAKGIIHLESEETLRHDCESVGLREGRDGVAGLNRREEQIIKLIRQAKLNKEIAYELKLAEGTVREYLSRLYRKLGVKNRTELAVWGSKMLQR